eukprot:CAMPEP_0178416522 /NCGR_PEP_ID=MMETSP0689_2-20121128/24107_1 /TAXON_ID=160604 /ORGANISM="Amphidinium massartii, Strain CS-259" /LENGTH=328 /DNA_ID=CAMNT_0020037869 /DNA_START=76 /DNA_END=1058 /DNA_ORIENTATION=-
MTSDGCGRNRIRQALAVVENRRRAASSGCAADRSAGEKRQVASPAALLALHARGGPVAEEHSQACSDSSIVPVDVMQDTSTSAEVSEVMSRLLSHADNDVAQVPGQHVSHRAFMGPPSLLRPPGPRAPAKDYAEMVAGLQAKVDSQAARLRRDLELLTERKNALLRQGVAEEIAKDTKEALLQKDQALREEADRIVCEVWSRFAKAKVEYDHVLGDIDNHIHLLATVQQSADDELRRQEQAREECFHAVATWIAEAKACHEKRLDARLESDVAKLRRAAATCLYSSDGLDDGEHERGRIRQLIRSRSAPQGARLRLPPQCQTSPDNDT